MTNEQIIWNFLIKEIKNEYGVAALMGNLYAESALNPKNLQSSYEKKLNYTDETYTAAVDNGTYNKFMTDAAGYGLAQWTYSTRKADLLIYARNNHKSIGDLEMQLSFLVQELQQYSKVWKALINATNIRDASNTVLFSYEKPADQSEAMQEKRANFGQKYYDKYVATEVKKMAIDYDKYIYSTGTHYLSNSGGDEKGGIGGGIAGDQTGREWELRSYYSRPWTHMFRYEKDARVGRTLAELGIEAALNNKIGYNQYQRGTYWAQLKNSNYRPSQITVACEADCSAGAAANIKACGYLLNIDSLKNVSASMTSRNTISQLKNAGFTMYTASKFINSNKYLLPGDILLNENHHVSTNVTKGSLAEELKTTPVTDNIINKNIIGQATALTNMHVRDGAGVSHSSLGIIKKGTVVNVLEIYNHGWYKIEYNNGVGYTSNSTGTYYDYTPIVTTQPVIDNNSISITTLKNDVNLAGQYRIINAQAINIRKGPGTNYEIIQPVNDSVILYSDGYYSMVDETQWLHVKYFTTNSTLEGFASGRYLQKINT